MTPARKRPRIAAVSFLNSKPLLAGLEGEAEVYLDIPSRLLEGLASGVFDVALLPVADIPKVAGARVVTWVGGEGGDGREGGGIACEGETLTVRIFSDRPVGSTRVLHCDTDSHTSVQLARVILRERYGVSPEFRPLSHREVLPESGAILLIGDKVITSPPEAGRFPHQYDLGQEWKALTGMPFVFAAWTARAGYEWEAIAPALRNALRRGLATRPQLAAEFAPRHGWPVDVAERYFTKHLRYVLGPREFEAMRHFWKLAAQ